MGSAWDEATDTERVLALIFEREPWWLRLAMRVTVYLPGRAGAVFDRLERYRNDRAMREWRASRRVHRS